jgi:hypothetical protein
LGVDIFTGRSPQRLLFQPAAGGRVDISPAGDLTGELNAGCMADVQYLPALVSRDSFSLLQVIGWVFSPVGVHSLLQPAA